MKVEGKYRIRSRGDVYTTTVDRVDIPGRDLLLRRARDGAELEVLAVERLCKDLNLPHLKPGEVVGLLLKEGPDLEVGEELELVPRRQPGLTRHNQDAMGASFFEAWRDYKRSWATSIGKYATAADIDSDAKRRALRAFRAGWRAAERARREKR